MIRPALPVLLALALAACGLLPKPPPAPEAFRPLVTVTPRAARVPVLALELATPASLYDGRAPMLRGADGSWRRLPGFQFAAPPPELAQLLLADALERSGLAAAVLTGATARPRLTLELRAFEAVDDADGRHVVVAWTLRLREGSADHARRIDARALVEGRADDPTALMRAWQAATRLAIEQSLDWLSRLPSPEARP
ncbi:MAG: hypothetical protein MUE46_11750 [Xanthomonadales bacterium]|jgi:ABC-type uncharacterized transport system auxiliary subunit|nr:hypothetical protein [Xanthomonadales bacterium]